MTTPVMDALVEGRRATARDRGGRSSARCSASCSRRGAPAGLAGIVADGFCRDVRGLREIGLPVFARGTNPRPGPTVSRAPPGAKISCGGVAVSPGDIVFGDDDGLLIATAERIAAALETAELIARGERAILAAQARGEALHGLTNHREHVAALDSARPARWSFASMLTSPLRSRAAPTWRRRRVATISPETSRSAVDDGWFPTRPRRHRKSR